MDTLFTEHTCPVVERSFLLFWKYKEREHDWREIHRWSTPLHYGTAFHTQFICAKCWAMDIKTYEAYGP